MLNSKSTEMASNLKNSTCRSKIHLYSLSVQPFQLHKAISMFTSVNNVSFNMVFVDVVLFSNRTQMLCYMDTKFHLVYFTLFTSKIHLFQMSLAFSRSQTCIQSIKLYTLEIFFKKHYKLFCQFLTSSPMGTGNSGIVSRKSVTISMGNLTLIWMNIFKMFVLK